MDSYIKILTDDLEKGYSKSDLEKLIGLPKNNLSGILKGDRKLSKKSKLKIEKWDKSEKPNPLLIGWLNEFDENAITKVGSREFFEIKPTEILTPISSPVAGKTVTVTLKSENHSYPQQNAEQTDWKVKDDMNRIKVLEKELDNPPTTSIIGVKNWIKAREIELSNLKAKYNLK